MKYTASASIISPRVHRHVICAQRRAVNFVLPPPPRPCFGSVTFGRSLVLGQRPLAGRRQGLIGVVAHSALLLLHEEGATPVGGAARLGLLLAQGALLAVGDEEQAAARGGRTHPGDSGRE